MQKKSSLLDSNKIGLENLIKRYEFLTNKNVKIVKADNSFEPLKTSVPPEINGILNEEIWKTSTGFTGFKTYIPDFDKPHEEKTIAYITYDNENIYYLAQNGELFLIKKVLKSVKKINYYKTRDFILFDNYIIFNDSINLIKYNLKKDTHELIYTFEKDNISFVSNSPLVQQGVLKHQLSDNFLLKYSRIAV